MKNNLISIIVPCYNVEKYIETCINSLINQSYANIEIICVNDGSTDSTKDKLVSLKNIDDRIIIIDHEKNLGLFRARVTGMHYANGDYIAFVDSDDHVDVDYYRCLIEKANENDYDIVIGDTVHEDDNGYRWIHSAYSDIIINPRYDKDVLYELLKQEGYCFIWHAVWNKIYKSNIIKEALPYFDNINDHLIMGEDVLFSCIFHYYAKSYAKADYAYYFYLQRKGASTALDNDINKFKKNIYDLGKIFYYVNLFFDINNVDKQSRFHFDKWRELYSRYWYDNVYNSALSIISKQKLYSQIKKNFHIKELTHTKNTDHWFYKISIPFDNRYIELKKNIAKYDIISIDIFDTLIVRKVYKPTDVFLFMDKWFRQLSGRQFDFSHARVYAEKIARKQSPYEEVNLDDIYKVFADKNGIPLEIIEKAKQKEIDTEKKLCSLRNSVADIIKYAHAIGKTVVLTSDFYFKKEQLIDLLTSLNAEYDDVILSSEFRATKASGSLFKILIGKYENSKIFHIGNSWNSDYVKAKESGVDAYFYASTTSAFMYEISDICSTDSTRIYKRPTGLWDNFEHSMDFFEVRCLLAQVSNKLYDNPYTSYLKLTDFNAQARFFGYYALGMHLWGVAKWLYENETDSKGKLHFVARDGYLPMLAYHQINNENSAADFDYFYASRKALFPLCWLNKFDVDCISVQLKRATPVQLLTWFAPVLDKQKKDMVEKSLISSWKSAVLEGDDLYEFVEKVLAPCYSIGNKDTFVNALRKYYGNIIKQGDSVFDIGYGGRSLMHLSELLGFPLRGYFVHRINDQFTAKQNALGIKVNTYYNYTPSITGVIRETLFSKQSPSCIGFSLDENGFACPKFESDTMTYSAKFAVEEVQRYALELVKDIVPLYKTAPELFSARSSDVSAPYEYMLHCSPAQDREYFSCVNFEDDVFFGDSAIKLVDIWKNDINYHHVMSYSGGNAISPVSIIDNDGHMTTLNYDATRNWSKIKKALYYFLFDNKTFWKKLKNRKMRKQKNAGKR